MICASPSSHNAQQPQQFVQDAIDAVLVSFRFRTKEGKKRKRKVRGGQKTWEEKQRTGSAPIERQPKNRERKPP
jgi:hypothetical protein